MKYATSLSRPPTTTACPPAKGNPPRKRLCPPLDFERELHAAGPVQPESAADEGSPPANSPARHRGVRRARPQLDSRAADPVGPLVESNLDHRMPPRPARELQGDDALGIEGHHPIDRHEGDIPRKSVITTASDEER
jgi:hypothetical protein